MVSNVCYRPLKVIGIDAIRYATYDFLLVIHCKYVSILYRFRDIVTYLRKFKASHAPDNTSYRKCREVWTCSFLVTVCKMVHPMLSDRCLSVVSVCL